MASRSALSRYTVMSAEAPAPRCPRSCKPRLRAGPARVRIAISSRVYSRVSEPRMLWAAAARVALDVHDHRLLGAGVPRDGVLAHAVARRGAGLSEHDLPYVDGDVR